MGAEFLEEFVLPGQDEGDERAGVRRQRDGGDEPAALEALCRAARAGMSERTFSRRFREQTGTTPVQWLLRARVRRAQYLLEKQRSHGGADRGAGGLRVADGVP